ncbi:hypothetical protein SVIOM342S_09215 [Streptomyces violaceorubidus]
MTGVSVGSVSTRETVSIRTPRFQARAAIRSTTPPQPPRG